MHRVGWEILESAMIMWSLNKYVDNNHFLDGLSSGFGNHCESLRLYLGLAEAYFFGGGLTGMGYSGCG